MLLVEPLREATQFELLLGLGVDGVDEVAQGMPFLNQWSKLYVESVDGLSELRLLDFRGFGLQHGLDIFLPHDAF